VGYFKNKLIDYFINIEEFKKGIEQLKDRCNKSGLKINEIKDDYVDDDTGENYISYKIEFKEGRNNRLIDIDDLEGVNSFLDLDFENYVFLSKYNAICSYKNGVIEAQIEHVNRRTLNSLIYSKLFGEIPDKDEGINREKFLIELSHPENPNILIELGYPSREALFLLNSSASAKLTIRVSGIYITNHDHAVSYLEKISNSLFFQIDTMTNLPLKLSGSKAEIGGHFPKKSKVIDKLTFPKSEYHFEPISLYWYGRGAKGLPLLEFLAHYQVLEYYFPYYTELEAKRTISNMLKDPTFNSHNESDIVKIINTVKRLSGTGRNIEEKKQLESTLNECIDIPSLKSFISNTNIINFFNSSDYKKISAFKLIPDLKDEEFFKNVVNRVYDIRCKIVHTKTSAETGNSNLILPFSREASALEIDVKIIRYLSERVLIAGSKDIRFD